MIKKVTVIGLGTLGGFLCKHLSELENIKEIVIVDFDKIESRDVYRSIYSISNIGEYKVDALSEIIESNVTVTKLNKKYIEGKTKIPKSDLVIDCRDFVYDRHTEEGPYVIR